MLKSILTILVSNITFGVFAQGTVTFTTSAAINGGAGARVLFSPIGTPGGEMTSQGWAASGTNWSAQLYASPGHVTDKFALTPVGERVPMRTGSQAGFVEDRSTQMNPFTGNPINNQVAVTPVPGGSVTVQFRVWLSEFSSFEDAVDADGYVVGVASPLLYLDSTGIGGSGGTPGTFLNGLPSPINVPITYYWGVVPEPSFSLLVLSGLATLLLIRRR